MFVENFGVQAVVLVVVLLSYLEVRVCNQGFHVVLWRSVPLFRVVGFGCRGGGEEDSFVLLLGGIILYLNTNMACLLYTSPSPRDGLLSRMPSSA